jgi:Fe-S-cluster-containing hydrogenase component 2
VADGGRPACVVACPARALIHVDARHALQALRSGKRLQACKLL